MWFEIQELLFRIVLIAILRFSLTWASRALKDADVATDDEIPVKELVGTNWVILRKSMTWEEAYWNCEVKYFRLVMLPTLDKAQELVRNIADASEPFTPEYSKKRHEVEFGMDRRYWTGLTDQLQEGKWSWIHNGSELQYNFWYPNQPDHKKYSYEDVSREHCVLLWNPGFYYGDLHSFNDERCIHEHYAICEIKDESNSTTPTTPKPSTTTTTTPTTTPTTTTTTTPTTTPTTTTTTTTTPTTTTTTTTTPTTTTTTTTTPTTTTTTLTTTTTTPTTTTTTPTTTTTTPTTTTTTPTTTTTTPTTTTTTPTTTTTTPTTTTTTPTTTTTTPTTTTTTPTTTTTTPTTTTTTPTTTTTTTTTTTPTTTTTTPTTTTTTPTTTTTTPTTTTTTPTTTTTTPTTTTTTPTTTTTTTKPLPTAPRKTAYATFRPSMNAGK